VHLFENDSFFEKIVLPQLYKILGLVDKNPISSTFGCFDRAYHHYKSKSFTNTMMQCYGMILAEVYNINVKSNPFYKDEQIKRLALASVRFTISASRKDGSCDEHYLGEDSQIARVFSLISIFLILDKFPETAMSESDSQKLQCLINWINKNPEDAIIGNHIAATILMYVLANKYFDGHYSANIKKWVKKLKSIQNDEGWFIEYDGADLGYQTLSNLFLLKTITLFKKRNKLEDKEITEDLEQLYLKSMAFLSQFITPDGTLPANFGSRNTSHLFIYGFLPFIDGDHRIKSIIEKFEINYINGNIERMEDDTFAFFPLIDFCLSISEPIDYTWMQTISGKYIDILQETIEKRTQEITNGLKIITFSESGFYIIKNNNFSLWIATKPVMAIECFKENQLNYRDMGYSYLLIDKTDQIKRCTMAEVYLIEFSIEKGEISMKGKIREIKKDLLSPLKQIMLLLAGLFSSARFIKKLIKKFFIKKIVNRNHPIIGEFYRKIRINLHSKDEVSKSDLLSLDIHDDVLFKRKPKKMISYKDFIKNIKYVPSNGFYSEKRFLPIRSTEEL